MTTPASFYAIHSASAHSIGKVRRYNEDAMYRFDGQLMRLNRQEALGLYIIADGMGGHADGDKASACTVTAFVRCFFEEVFCDLLEAEEEPESIPERLASCMVQANQELIQRYPGSGTTFTVALVTNRKVYGAHVGDSRLFVLDKANQLEQLTHDHSLVQVMIDLGELTPEEALNHPRRSVLLRSLGFKEELDVDTLERELQPGDRLLLCCDGLWSVVDEEGLIKIINQTDDLQKACDALVEAANDAGGPDNISCILIEPEK